MDLSSSLLWLVCILYILQEGGERRTAAKIQVLFAAAFPTAGGAHNTQGKSTSNFTEEESSLVGPSKEPKQNVKGMILRGKKGRFFFLQKRTDTKSHVKRMQLKHWILRCLVRYRWFSVQVFLPFAFKLIFPPAKELKTFTCNSVLDKS